MPPMPQPLSCPQFGNNPSKTVALGTKLLPILLDLVRACTESKMP